MLVLFFAAPWLTLHWFNATPRIVDTWNSDIETLEAFSAAALVTQEARELEEKGLAAPIHAFEPGSLMRESVELEILLAFWATVFVATVTFLLAPRRFARLRFAAALFALAAALTLTELARLSPDILLRLGRPPSILDAPIIFRAATCALFVAVASFFAPRAAMWLARAGAVAAVIDAVAISDQQDWAPSATVILLAVCVWLLGTPGTVSSPPPLAPEDA